MKIYFARHGQTSMNVADEICGVTNCELTEKGLKQAEMLAEKCAEVGDIDIILCSPLKRARDTALAVSRKIGAKVEIAEGLTEWNYGSFEGKHRKTEGFAEAKCQFGVKMPDGGESLLQLAHRVYSVIDMIREKYKDKNVLCVCHGGVCRIAETYFKDMTVERFNNFFMGNCELRCYEID